MCVEHCGSGLDIGMQKLLRAAEAGDVDALYRLGDAYRYGVCGVRQDAQKAFLYHSKAAALGYIESAYALALDSLFYGHFCPWPQEEGARVLKAVAEKSLNPDPWYWYARICFEGIGMPRNLYSAKEWLQRCIDYMGGRDSDAEELLQEVEAELAAES